MPEPEPVELRQWCVTLRGHAPMLVRASGYLGAAIAAQMVYVDAEVIRIELVTRESKWRKTE